MLMVIIVMPLLFNNLVVKEKGGGKTGRGLCKFLPLKGGLIRQEGLTTVFLLLEKWVLQTIIYNIY